MPDTQDASKPSMGDDIGQEGKAAPGEPEGSRGPLDGASGGYGSASARESSGGTGDGDAAATEGSEPGMDDRSTTSAGGSASGEGPTEWLRHEATNPQD